MQRETISDHYLKNLAVEILYQALTDAQMLGSAVQAEDPDLKRRLKERYWWAKYQNPEFPEDERKRLCEWFWGEQFEFLTDYLKLDEDAVRAKLEQHLCVYHEEREE